MKKYNNLDIKEATRELTPSNTNQKATREIHQNPTKVGLDLISLDNNYTNKYNCNNDESSSFHLCSFRGIDYLPRGCRLVAKTPQNYIKKLSKFFIPLILSTQLVASGIPVVDAAANAQMTMQNAKQAAEWMTYSPRINAGVSSINKSSLLL